MSSKITLLLTVLCLGFVGVSRGVGAYPRALALRGGGIFGRKVGGRFGGTLPLRPAEVAESPAGDDAAEAAAAGAATEEKPATAQVGLNEEGEGGAGGEQVAESSSSKSAGLQTVVQHSYSACDMSLRRREKENDGQETTFRFNETLVRSYSDTVCAVRPSSKRFGLDCMQQIRSARYIYIVSDSTGFTASHALTSVMAQFESVSVDWAGDSDVFNTSQLEVRTQMFSNVNDKVRLTRIVRLAATMKAFIVYTLMTPELNEQMVSYCYSLNVPCEDMLGPMVRNIAGFLGMHPSGEPRGSTNVKRKPLSDKYFSRIAAVEFTIRQDDGNLPSNLGKADVVLLGVSRSSKTPLSVYLAQQFGYRVANIPIIKDMPLPKELLEVDPRRVFGLTIAGPYLKRIRSRRLAETAHDTSAMSGNEGSFDYDNMKYINAELAWSKDLYSQHPEWSVIDVTGRSVEENAAIINELLGISTGKPTPVEAALHALDANFFMIDPHCEEGRHSLVFASDGFLEATGYKREEIIGKDISSLHGPETNNETIAQIRSSICKGQEGYFEILNYRKDGTTYKKKLSLAPVHNQEGVVEFIFATQCELDENFTKLELLGSDDDFEGNQVLQTAARAKKTQFLDAQARGGISVFLLEVSPEDSKRTLESMPLKLASDAFFETTGFLPSQILGQTLSFLFGKETDQTTIGMIEGALERKTSVSTCIICYKKDGTSFWNHLSLQPVFDMKGELQFYVGTQFTSIARERLREDPSPL